MKKVKEILSRLVKDDSGQDLVEYALVVAVVATTTLALSNSFSIVITNAVTAIGARITAIIG
jgi:pilus assembly protein Flp/PilA